MRTGDIDERAYVSTQILAEAKVAAYARFCDCISAIGRMKVLR